MQDKVKPVRYPLGTDALDVRARAHVASGRAQAKSPRDAWDQPVLNEQRLSKKRTRGPRQRSAQSPQHVYQLQEIEIDEMVQAEFYRPVILREGGKKLELPLIRAILRELGNDALQGDRQAQQKVLELLRRFDVRLRAIQAKKVSVKHDFSRLSADEADTLEKLLNKSLGSDYQERVEKPD
jgi:hypothetical protein